MDTAVRSTLLRVADVFASRRIGWQLGGSGLLHALGLTDRVRDLDLVFPPEAAEALVEALDELTGSRPRLNARQEPGFVSGWRGRHEVGGVELDMTSQVTIESTSGVVRLPFEEGAAWDLDGRTIPLAPVTHWIVIYRHHNPDRAALLEPMIDAVEWSSFADRIGIPSDFGAA